MQIYNFFAPGDKGELIRFRGQKVKCQDQDQTEYGQKSAFGVILLPYNIK